MTHAEVAKNMNDFELLEELIDSVVLRENARAKYGHTRIWQYYQNQSVAVAYKHELEDRLRNYANKESV